MSREKITAKWIEALIERLKHDRPEPGARWEWNDDDLPALRIRATSAGFASYQVRARWGGPKVQASRRTIGPIDPKRVTLKQAREIAAKWLLELQVNAVDPTEVKKAKRAEEAKKRAADFETALTDYIAGPIATHRRAHETELRLKRELLPRWKRKSIHDITRDEVIAMVEDVARRGRYAAANAFAQADAFFGWAMTKRGLPSNPCDGVDLEAIIGPRSPRQRVLNDREIWAVWHAAGEMETFGALTRFLLLTGLRLNEAAGCVWPEISIENRLLTVPSERFKSGRTHLCPLSDDAIALLNDRPTFEGGQFVFSLTGERPVSNISRNKAKLDRIAAARLGAEIPGWRLHDLRRTTRTRLASLRVPPHVAELVIGHGLKGLERTYNQHQFEREMRSALNRWQKLLRSIVTKAEAP